MFNPLCSSTNQDLCVKHLCNQGSHNEKYNFHYEWKPSHVSAKSIRFAISKDEWDTKEDTGRSMKDALYVLRRGVASQKVMEGQVCPHEMLKIIHDCKKG